MDKQDIKNYVDTHATIFSSKDPHYKMVLTTAKQGLYSGIAYVNMANTYRYVDFIIDFPGKEVTLRGFSTKKLKENTKNLGAIFDYGNFEASEEATTQEKEFVKNIKSIGSFLGQIYPEQSLILGRGIIRAIKDFPVVELLAKSVHNFKDIFYTSSYFDSDGGYGEKWFYIISVFQHPYNQNKSKSIRKIMGLSKGEFKYFINPSNSNTIRPIYRNCFNNRFISGHDYDDYVSHLVIPEVLQGMEKYFNEFIGKVRNTYNLSKIYNKEFIYKVCKDIDDVRGYHDAEKYYEDLYPIVENFVLDKVRGFNQMDATNIFDTDVSSKSDFEHLIQYLYGSLYHQQAIERVYDQLQLYRDYLDMVSKFKRFNKFPRYLKTAHDIAIRNYKEIDKDGANIFPQYLKHKSLEGTFGDWAMILMASSKEIVEEGNQQSNCVGSYVHYVNDGVSLILGMRKKESQDKSEVTLELQEGKDGLKAVQYYSTFNNALSKEEHDALVEWCNRKGVWIKDKSEMKYTGNFGKIDKSIHEEAEKEYEERLEKAKTFNINKGLENMPKAV